MVRKLPQKDYAFNGTVGAGTDDTYQGQMDVTGKLNASGTLRGRAVMAWQRLGNDDGSYNKTSDLYGVIDADVTPETTLELGASFEANSGRPQEPFAEYDDGTYNKPGRNTYQFPMWNHRTSDITTVFGSLTHHFDDDWVSKLQGTYIHDTNDMRQFAGVGANSAAIDMTEADWEKYGGHSSTQSYDAYASGPVYLFGRKNVLKAGANYTQNRSYNRWDTGGWYSG